MSKDLDNLNEEFEDEIEEIDDDIDDIDIDSDDDVDDDNEDSDFDIKIKNSIGKHKIEGKHSLDRDTIFFGKVEESVDENLESSFNDYYEDSYTIETGTIQEEESLHQDKLYNKRELSQEVYQILKKNTKLDFYSNRRKPNKQTFNNYFQLLINELDYKYEKCEIFVELSYYFTDNIYNMFKLLNKELAISIIKELRFKGYLDGIGDINFV